jgi:hypothetical protein
MTLTFADAVRLIDDATTYAELRRSVPGDAYRLLVKIIHPDTVDNLRKDSATTAFLKLSQLHDGQFDKAHEGDIADLFLDREGRLVKVPRSPADNDLMEAEAEALRRLHDHGDPKFRPYAPRLLESYVHEDADRRRRRVNVLERLDGFVPLSSLGRTIDWRDAAWMWRRLLVGLGWAHQAGVIHGAVLEEHVLIHPAEHGLALVDWCYSGSRPKAIVKHRQHAYPPEIKKKTATPATDIFMATGLMTRLIGPGIPGQLRRFADGCAYDAPRMRPQDAWQLLGELDDILGPRTFRPFTA